MGGGCRSTGYTVVGSRLVLQIGRNAVGKNLGIYVRNAGGRAIVITGRSEAAQAKRNSQSLRIHDIRQGIQVHKHIVAVGTKELGLGRVLLAKSLTKKFRAVVLYQIVNENVAGVDGFVCIFPDTVILLCRAQNLHFIGLLQRRGVGNVYNILTAAIENHISQTGHERGVRAFESVIATQKGRLNVSGIGVHYTLNHGIRLVLFNKRLIAGAQHGNHTQYSEKFDDILHNKCLLCFRRKSVHPACKYGPAAGYSCNNHRKAQPGWYKRR